MNIFQYSQKQTNKHRLFALLLISMLMALSTAYAQPPAAAMLTSPSGSLDSDSPAYTWNAVSNASWYFLWVDDSSGNAIKQWYRASEAGCASGHGTCSVTPGTALNHGTGRWWIQTWNADGYGSWSNAMSFAVGASLGAAALVAPQGDITVATPKYSWNAVASASWYYLWVNDSSGNAIKQWYRASEVGCGSGSGTCSMTHATSLNQGAGQWWVQTWNAASGYGPWSSAMSFDLGSVSNAQVLLQDGFEGELLNRENWDVTWWTPDGQLPEGIEPELVDYPVRAGRHALKIRAEASWNGYEKYSRTEIQGKRNDTKNHITFFYPGREYWIGFSLYLPADWQPDFKSREVIFQLHGNGGGGQYGIPPLALTVDGNEWFWGISSSQDPTPDEADEYGRTPLIKGEWVDFVIHAKFSNRNDGYGLYEFWRNGEMLFTRNGPNCYDDEKKIRGPQMGIYKWDWSQSGEYEVSDRTIYLDEISVGDAASSYNDVVPGGGMDKLSNVALNKSVSYSSQENDNDRAASNVVDGVDNNGNDRWSASSMPQWVEVDLGQNYYISKTELVSFQDRAYHFTVEAKAEGSNSYTLVVDRLGNGHAGSSSSPITDTFSGTLARYVRLTVNGAENYTGDWSSILEFRVFGTSKLLGYDEEKSILELK